MRKKKTEVKVSKYHTVVIEHQYISFYLDNHRILQCWIGNSSGFFQKIWDVEVPFIRQVVIPDIEKYWALGHTMSLISERGLHVKCITILNPSWRRQVQK